MIQKLKDESLNTKVNHIFEKTELVGPFEEAKPEMKHKIDPKSRGVYVRSASVDQPSSLERATSLYQELERIKMKLQASMVMPQLT